MNTEMIQQQTLKLTMTQELSQAIELLQLSTIELMSFLENKSLENPLITIENKYVTNRSSKKGSSQGSRDNSWIDSMGQQQLTLEDYILPQLQDVSFKQQKIVRHYIHYLDYNGYFTGDLKEVSKYLQISMDEAENCLFILQQVEPAGIGARNLQECLLLQARRDPNRNHLIDTIISDYFTMFAERKWKELAKILSIAIKEIQEVYDYIFNLNPKPGASYHFEQPMYIIPDVMIVLDGGEFTVKLYDKIFPNIYFNKAYFKEISSCKETNVIKYLQEKKNDFEWMMRCLEQREKTILRVTEKIIEKQREYFVKGAECLKPLTMKEVSEELAIHESTVSRTVRGKFAQTPFGTIELRAFFLNSIDSLGDEGLSSSRVKRVMLSIINSENKLKPLSDLELVNVLKDKEGIMISRRTIAKYREQLGIPSSTKRKRFE